MAEASSGLKKSPTSNREAQEHRMAGVSSGLKKSPSYRETQELLQQHIRRQRLLKKHSQQSGVQCTSDVRREAEKILNEFLKKQLQKELKQSPILSQHYQKVVVEDEYEHSQEFDDEYIMKGENFSGDEYGNDDVLLNRSVDVIDDIPYIDGVEDDDGRSRSLPSSIQFSVKQPKVPKSKSLTPQSLLTKHGQDQQQIDSNGGLLPQPESLSSKSPSPIPSNEMSSKPVEPTRERRRFRSGSISSSDTDTGGVISPDRKKKSVFKRLQERVARAVSRDREKMELDGKESPDTTKKKKKKRKARSKKRKEDHGSDIDILKEKHTHREGHIEQHHGGDNDDILLRTNETWESTDITDFEKSQSKHLDKHTKIKESTDLSASSEKGFFGAIKRITSRKNKKTKSPKSSIKSSQSAYIQPRPGNENTKSYDRILSLPSGQQDLNLQLTETTSSTNVGKHKHTTKSITSARSPSSQGLPKMGPIHEKSRSEPVQPTQPMISNDDPTGSTIPHNFRFRQISRQEDVKIPENRSFNIDYSIDERERTVRTKDGDVKVETDIQRSQLSPNDLEIDGSGMSVAAGGGRSPRGTRSRQESDIEEDMDDIRISRVAARIAEMGDTYMSEASQVSSPTRSPDERDGEGLTELERKIRDCFRDFGDTVNDKISLQVEPKQAAIDFARQVTYSKFKDTVHSVVGDNVGWQQLAMVFYLTRKATQLAGAGGAVASQLKENCLQYVEDHFASWILNQGGWDSVLESDETDFDVD